MAVNEVSIRALYTAIVKLEKGAPLVHVSGCIQQHPPFRRGKVLIVKVLPRRGIAVGVWTRRKVPDWMPDWMADELWILPESWDNLPPEDLTKFKDIANWFADDAETPNNSETERDTKPVEAG